MLGVIAEYAEVGQSRADRRNSPQKPGPHLVNRKLDFLARELKRYGVSIAAIQETKWYGNDVWQANGYTFFHSGRPLPCAEETAVRNEGVGIMLDERASAAWREAGEAWEAISSRVVTARLKAMGRGQRRPGGARTTRNSFISVISAYAPTARAPPGIKSKFMEELQDVLDKVPSSDLLLLLGDFNARVGCSDTNGELWRGIRGRYGIGAGNEAGDRLLEFCAVNQLTVMQRNNRMPMSESLTKCCMITHITPTGQQSTTGVH